MTSAEDASIDHVVALERRLLQPEVRASTGDLMALLDPEFREIGASGRFWDRAGIVESLTRDDGCTSIRDEEMEGTLLAENVVLLTYVTDAGGRRARRTSVWRRDADAGWRLLHHQGTLTDEP